MDEISTTGMVKGDKSVVLSEHGQQTIVPGVRGKALKFNRSEHAFLRKNDNTE